MREADDVVNAPLLRLAKHDAHQAALVAGETMLVLGGRNRCVGPYLGPYLGPI